MEKLMRWAASQGHWLASEFLGLPKLQPEADPMVQRWLVVAGGLALLLSRLMPTERKVRYAATNRLYSQLRRRLRRGERLDAPPELISDVMHEIAGVADPQTVQCLRACFQASLRPQVRTGDEATQSELGHTSRLQSQPRPSRATPRWTDTLPTDFNEEKFNERAQELRSRIAAARSSHSNSRP